MAAGIENPKTTHALASNTQSGIPPGYRKLQEVTAPTEYSPSTRYRSLC